MRVGSPAKPGRPLPALSADTAGGAPADAPRWDLSTVYPGFESAEYAADRAALTERVARFADLARGAATEATGSATGAPDPLPPNPGPTADTTAWLEACIAELNEIYDLFETLEVYCYASYSVDTTNTEILAELNALNEIMLPVHGAFVEFRDTLAAVAGTESGEFRDTLADRLAGDHPALADYRFFLQEQLHLQQRQMTAAEENLAADLSRSGADAWSRLQETVSANLTAEWNRRTGERKTVVQLRGLAFDPDRDVRRRAYEAEIAAWKQMEIPLAAALNGVKGTSIALDGRRGYASSLERARESARISPQTLDALLGVMEDSLPAFRRYLSAKARAIGVRQLAFYDLFAPLDAGQAGTEAQAGTDGPATEAAPPESAETADHVDAARNGGSSGRWSFADARRIIVEQFRSFSHDLGDFADRAFAEQWIDAEPREGKVGGAYCAPVPRALQSRILANFDGSFSSVSTVAHELGHAYHHEVLKTAPAIHRDYPMTLAETASIFCETIVFTGAYDRAPESEKLGILDAYLQDATQVIVDILSRYRFESALFERRRHGELSPTELKELMLEAQRHSYGEGLDPDLLHPYMWAVKGHYYNQDLAFYNFPYAFGQLFGLGLYAQYREQGASFPPQYRRILEMTGRASAEEVTAQAGFDITTREFWQSGIDYIRERIEEFVQRVDAEAP